MLGRQLTLLKTAAAALPAAKITVAIAIVSVFVAGLSASMSPSKSIPRHTPFTISAVATISLLTPGSTVALDLSLTNPNTSELAITKLTTQVGGINISAAHGQCGADNFMVRQFSGTFGFVVGPAHSTTLSELGIPAESWPQLVMINLPVNQDSCKSAMITLRFIGAGMG